MFLKPAIPPYVGYRRTKKISPTSCRTSYHIRELYRNFFSSINNHNLYVSHYVSYLLALHILSSSISNFIYHVSFLCYLVPHILALQYFLLHSLNFTSLFLSIFLPCHSNLVHLLASNTLFALYET